MEKWGIGDLTLYSIFDKKHGRSKIKKGLRKSSAEL
jgi:hypothetical protein